MFELIVKLYKNSNSPLPDIALCSEGAKPPSFHAVKFPDPCNQILAVCPDTGTISVYLIYKCAVTTSPIAIPLHVTLQSPKQVFSEPLNEV